MQQVKLRLKGGDEMDAFSRHRKQSNWKAGQIKKLQRRYNKRLRRHFKIRLSAV